MNSATEIWGYLASALIGISLGLIGGGGSILTVPVMVYLFGLQPLLATSYSLFIVGATSMIGAVTHYRKGLVNGKAALYFGLSSMVTVFLTRKFLLPALPKEIATIGGFTLTPSLLTMVLFAILMLAASISMIRGGSKEAPETPCTHCERFIKLLGYGVAIGGITGLLGAGGGFLLIPALVFLVKMPMKKAVGTSLLIIAVNSLVGFAGDTGHVAINWSFLLTISAIAAGGIYLGGLLGKKIDGAKLKKGFGWFVLLMGIYILIRELLLVP
ncbi:sulfite exporter TauE/SafE family protein [Paraflavisolibacter sp. H34]|uniref:sulfite exporter TauE/SafE family protein n=1 Tax=Huijunlia imazamoxiresistens TaxID=3127457 RepID=UPI00301705F4